MFKIKAMDHIVLIPRSCFNRVDCVDVISHATPGKTWRKHDRD